MPKSFLFLSSTQGFDFRFSSQNATPLEARKWMTRTHANTRCQQSCSEQRCRINEESSDPTSFCWIKYAVIYLRYPSPFLCSTIRFLFAAIESGCNKRFWFYWITRELQNNMNKPPNRVSIRFLHIRHSIFHIWTHFDEYNVGILSLPGTFVHPVCAWKMEILILIRCRPTYGCRNF